MTDLALPPGVRPYNRGESIAAARKNVNVAVFGAAKTGKTYFAVRSERPLYIAYLDPNPNLDAQLVQSEQDGFTGEVYKLVIPTMKYSLLTDDEATKRVRMVEQFADWARATARTKAAAGEPTGAFVIDGAVKLKGYIEKMLLGESATLGYRAQRGQRGGPSTYDYAASNAYMMDVVSAFAGVPLDVVTTWEGRRIWDPTFDDTGRRVGASPTDRYSSSMPDVASYAIGAQVETFIDQVPIVVDNKLTGQYRYENKIRIGWNAYAGYLQGRTMKAKTFKELKALFLGDLDDSMLEPEGTVVNPVVLNSEGLGGSDE